MNLFDRRRWGRLRFRLTHTSKFPKGDLYSFFLQLADQGFAPKHIFDIGANKTKWCKKALRVFPDCHFTLVEPQIELTPYLEKFCRRASNSQFLIAGISDQIGEMKLTLIPDTVSTGFLHSDESAAQNNWKQRTVPVYTLDYLVEKYSVIPDIVKIDAEGMEARIMSGASKLIGKTEIFLLEAPMSHTPNGWQSFGEIVALMSELGYECYEFTHMMKQPPYTATSLVEVAFARRNGYLRSSFYTPDESKKAA